MEILLQLGANNTAFIQFIVFILSVSFLTVVVYKPFFKAYDERHKLTKGADQVANETQDEAKKLSQIYSARAREINEKINTIFNASKNDSLKSSGIILEAAKTTVQQTTEEARKHVQTQKQSAEQQVKSIAQEVSSAIVNKLTGAL
ncbi:MAG: hypothetical protein A2622_05125 [Bdellovibrionales bacterium RIFCSPHIGHO2_01_FULL_40_29]|nr:MAG: hypothetical protein A2622_05125 [Bdellovibrionales bacterium RIFCSPHIGHO2_01_FULL_40_29]OFZ34690.1 MAG: hypothetical protein A3D17_10245 [Bdellovibrionales bacterium RIFCSPHIGHO2_02_FULL_40_15]